MTSPLIRFAAPLITGLLAAPAAHAIDAAQWQKVAPMLQAALECRAEPDIASAAWKALSADPYSTTDPITPPVAFNVFGLPVRDVSFYIDPDGEVGASYTATFATTKATVRAAAKLDGKGHRATRMGDLGVGGIGETQLTCTVAGTTDATDDENS
ncbi:hypothetical protein [Stenotrophomonas sp.]|uniref:hypothetical protein n=1 Tax=Stenotrophomonas sp. TaxID=69392 RepID=UPI002D342134|nr:hypothetical protein [Stenotrophomonas sp.]HYQ25064.1 hypothetical protein [Stenotrophomonas sp.]